MRQYILFLVSLILITIPVSAARPMTSLFAESLGAGVIQIGIIASCYSLGPLFIAIYSGRIIDKIGEKTPLICGSLIMVTSLAIPYFFTGLSSLYLSQLLLGIGQFLSLVSAQSGIMSTVSHKKRNKAITNLTLFTSIGLMLGPLAGGYLSENIGFSLSFIVLSLCSIGLLIISLQLKNKKQEKQRTTVQNKNNKNIKELLSVPSLKRIIIIGVIVLISLDIFNIYYPLYATSLGFSLSEIGWILTAQAASSVVIRLFLPIFINKIKIIKLLILALLFASVAYTLLSISTGIIPIIIIVSLLGATLGVCQPLSLMLINDMAPKNRTAEVFALRLAGNRLGQVAIPFLIASIGSFIGVSMIFIIQGFILGLGSLMSKGIKKNL